MNRAALVSVLAHVLVVALLLLGETLAGRAPHPDPLEPAQIELVIGKGGTGDADTLGESAAVPPQRPGGQESAPTRVEEDADTTTAPPVQHEAAAPPETEAVGPPPTMPPVEETAPPVRAEQATPAETPVAAPPPAQAEAAPSSEPVPPTEPAATRQVRKEVAPPTVRGAPAAVQLNDGAGRPYADLLDPEGKRFHAATQDSGNRAPTYPRDAAVRMESGVVRLQLFIDPAGLVTNVVVVRSSGSAALDRAARERLMTWRFTPARRDGRAVPDIAEIEISFELL